MRFIIYVDTCSSSSCILNAQYLLRDRLFLLSHCSGQAAVNPCTSQAPSRVSLGQKQEKASYFLGRNMCVSSVLLDTDRMLSKFYQYVLPAVVRVPVPHLPPLDITRL